MHVHNIQRDSPTQQHHAAVHSSSLLDGLFDALGVNHHSGYQVRCAWTHSLSHWACLLLALTLPSPMQVAFAPLHGLYNVIGFRGMSLIQSAVIDPVADTINSHGRAASPGACISVLAVLFVVCLAARSKAARVRQGKLGRGLPALLLLLTSLSGIAKQGVQSDFMHACLL